MARPNVLFDLSMIFFAHCFSKLLFRRVFGLKLFAQLLFFSTFGLKNMSALFTISIPFSLSS
jgi:hypothetical protein